MNMEAIAGKYLTFMLGKETYGIEILKVQEIIGLLPITRVPRAAQCIRGVINLRGKVIPVLDLARKFNMEPREDTPRTCIIVVQLCTEDVQLTMGLVVDDVSEVVDIASAQLEPAPMLGQGVDTDFLLGMGKISERVVMLLDVERILTSRDVEQLAESSGAMDLSTT
jgi:purine-binding chemotaxis protein CheW